MKKLDYKLIKNLKHRCIISLIYSAGLRRSELLNLQTKDIDTKRNLLIIRDGKGNKDRQTIISINLIEELRTYYIKHKPKTWLFEGYNEKKYSATSIAKILTEGAKKAKINKRVSPICYVTALQPTFWSKELVCDIFKNY